MERINVTKPFLPPKAEYFAYMDKIWDSNILTNNGPFVRELQEKMEEYLGADNIIFVSNGTISLQMAIQALNLKEEIITTPFSYIATTSSIMWERCKPVFVDIDKDSFNIDPNKIKEKITDKTTAILATHVFGNPCDLDQIQQIANEVNLKVIYDAAHCFGVKYNNACVLNYGDISSTSLHATKLFHTIEGGTLSAKSKDLQNTLCRMRNFGHNGPGKYSCVGINGKNSEYHAAMGLLNLKYMDDILKGRKQQYLLYKSLLKDENVTFQSIHKKADYNYSYFPVLFENEGVLLKVIADLNENNIYPRRYFHPSLNRIDIVNNEEIPISESISSRILCLPMYHGLTNQNIERIYSIISSSLKIGE